MPKAEADVMLRLTCESYNLSRETSVSHFNSHLRMVHERGSWFIDDFINVRGIDGSEKRQMKLHIENQGK